MVDLTRFRRRQQQSDRIHEKPARERHFLSIIGSVLSFIMLILSLALPEWAKGEDGECDYIFGLTQVKIANSHNPSPTQYSMSRYYTTSQQILISCILSVAVLTMISSIISTVISAGYPREKLEFLRHYAVFNIVSLLCIVLVAGLWLAVAETLPSGREDRLLYRNCRRSEANVNFGYSFYILLVAGLFSLGAASFNLLFARSAADRRRSVRLRFRQEQNRRQLTNRANLSHGTAPPVYSLLDTASDITTEAETSMSEPEYSEAEPSSPPPPYNP